MPRKHLARITLVTSVALNVALVAFIVLATRWVNAQSRERAAMVAEAEVRMLTHVRSEMDCDDPERIEALHTTLDAWIRNGTDAAALWRDGR